MANIVSPPTMVSFNLTLISALFGIKTSILEPNLINPGDTIIFERITENQYQNYNE